MGRSEVNKVSSLLRQVLIDLLKPTILPDSPSRERSFSEVIALQADAQWRSRPE